MNVFDKLIMATLLACPMGAWAGDLYVVANAGVNLAEGEVRDVFLGDKQMAGAIRLVPIDNASTQKEFLEKVIKIDASKYGAVWTKKGFRDGLNAPAVKSGDAEVLAFVRGTPGAVGYVRSKPTGVTIIEKY